MSASPVRVVEMAAEHIAAMQAIEKQSFPTSWPGDSFEKELRQNGSACYRVAVGEDGRVLGYIGSWMILDEVHITTMAVDPARRGEGLGGLLMASLLQEAVDRGARWTVLEVRDGNEPAVRLYQSFGFRQVGRRKKYYEDQDDALVMWVGQMQACSFREHLRGVLRSWGIEPAPLARGDGPGAG